MNQTAIIKMNMDNYKKFHSIQLALDATKEDIETIKKSKLNSQNNYRLKKYDDIELKNEIVDDIKNSNNELFQIEKNELVNSNNNYNVLEANMSKSIKNNLKKNLFNQNEENNIINGNNDFEDKEIIEEKNNKNKTSLDDFENLDSLPLID